MNIMRALVVPATCLLAAGCSGRTEDSNRGIGDAPPEYAGPVSLDGEGGIAVVGPTPVATHQYGALAVAVDDARVYWSTDIGGQTVDDWNVVRSCTKANCAPTVVTYASQQYEAQRIAVHRGRVYWRVTAGDSSSRSIVACPVDGCVGTPAVIASGPRIMDLLVDDQAVYFTSYTDSAVLSCPADGCRDAPTVVALLDDPAARLAADQNNLYWSEAVAADSGMIKTIPKDGSAPARTIVSGLHLPGAVAVGSDQVYWAEKYSPGTIRSCPIAGCAGEPATLASGLSYPQELAVDQAHAYWFTTANAYLGTGQIQQCPLGGCGSSPTVLATDQPTPTGLAIDPSFVYWTNQGEAKHDSRSNLYYDGSVNRVPIATP